MPAPGFQRHAEWAIDGEDVAWWQREWRARRDTPHSRRRRLLAPVIVSLVVQIPGVFFLWSQGSRPTLREWDSPLSFAFKLALMLIGPIALLFARRFPGPVVAVVALAAATDLLIAGDTDGPPYIAFAFAIGSAILRGARIWAWIAIVVTWVGTLVLSATLTLGVQPLRVVGISLGILIIIALAEFMRTRRERMEELNRTMIGRRQSEVQAERVRIARELHDVLAHSLSQINVQAGVGLHLIEKQPEKAAEALASIKDTSKHALDEVRSVLGVLRAEGGADPSAPLIPEPDLSRLPGLAASVTSQGIEVTLDNDLASDSVPANVQLALYRIVQESLTNVARHASATRASVTLAATEGSYRVTISDNGTAAPVASGGRGLLGMRERAELLGGALTAGPRSGGGFEVTADIPRTERS